MLLHILRHFGAASRRCARHSASDGLNIRLNFGFVADTRGFNRIRRPSGLNPISLSPEPKDFVDRGSGIPLSPVFSFTIVLPSRVKSRWSMPCRNQ